jgi:hypothetical protein
MLSVHRLCIFMSWVTCVCYVTACIQSKLVKLVIVFSQERTFFCANKFPYITSHNKKFLYFASAHLVRCW